MLLQLDIDEINDEEEQDEDNVNLCDVFSELGDDGVEEAIQEAEEEAEVEAAAHAAELADQAFMAEVLQIPTSTSTSAQKSTMESAGKTARLKRVSLQIFIPLVFNPKHCVLYLLLNVPCHKTKLKTFQIVYKCECVFFLG